MIQIKSRTARLISAAVLCLALAGCSSGAHAAPPVTSIATPPSSAPVPTPSDVAAAGTSAALEASVRAYSTAFFTGDATAGFGMLSRRCAAQSSLADYTGHLAAAHAIYGDGPTLLTVKVSVDGTTGSATYTYTASSVDQTDQPWTFEDGAWHYDQC